MSAKITLDLLALTQLRRIANRVGWKINGDSDTYLTPFLNLTINNRSGKATQPQLGSKNAQGQRSI
jgi:hypothetical protein